ncbi:cache domain-containing protein [Desulfocurvus sp. DL9XJH121]
MSKISISKTYLTRSSVVAVCFLILLGATWLHFDYFHFLEHSKALRARLLNEKKQMLQTRGTEIADYIQFEQTRDMTEARHILREEVSKARDIAQAHLAQGLSRDEAASRLKTALAAVRFANGNGYFFINDLQGNPILHPYVDKITSDHGYKNRPVFRRFSEVARGKGEGFIRYKWVKPDAPGEDHEKLAYIERFPSLGWTIGAGLYLEDVTTMIQNKILRWLNSRDYTDAGYLFAYRYDGTALVGPFMGENLLQSSAPLRRASFMKALDVARAGGGFVTYDRPAVHGSHPQEKISFVKGIEGWNWFVGCGFETSEIQDILAQVEKDFKRRTRNIILTVCAALLCFIAATYMGLRLATAGVKRDFRIFGEFFSRAAEEAAPIDTDKLIFEEFEHLAQAANRMTEERIKALDALRNSESRYRSIFENITDGYYRADIQGRLLLLSPSARRILQIAPDEDIARLNVADLYQHPDERNEFLNSIIKNGSYEGYHCTMVRRDGTPVDLEVNSRLILDEKTGQPSGVEGLFRDVTQRIQTQEILVQSEKMQSVGGLAAGMAHEINNPLGGILQGVQNMERRLDPNFPANQKAAMEVGCDLEAMNRYLHKRRIRDTMDGIREMGARAAEIVSRMLNFTRKSESRIAWHRLDDLVNAALDLAYSDYDLKKLYGFRDVDIVRDFDLTLPEISCTETEIQQVVLNIVTNAAQAMTQAGTEHPRITLRTRREDDYAVLVIEDNGPGMDEETGRQVFEPFFTTREPGKGTGLGLSSAYFIITVHHGGSILVHSKPGQGATFTILLPIEHSGRPCGVFPGAQA